MYQDKLQKVLLFVGLFDEISIEQVGNEFCFDNAELKGIVEILVQKSLLVRLKGGAVALAQFDSSIFCQKRYQC